MSPAEPAKVPRLVRVEQLVKMFDGAFKARTVRGWIAQAKPLETTTRRGRRHTIPGNGLSRAIIRKGGIVLIDVERFVAWLYSSEDVCS